MLTESDGRLPFIRVGGTSYDVGQQLGRHARAVVEQYLLTTHAWASVMACRDDPRIAAAKALTEARFPRYWQELQGLAAGLALPRSEEHTSELQYLMRNSYALFTFKKKTNRTPID